MQALAFWKAVTVDRSNLLERFVAWLQTRKVKFCLVGGQAVNASASTSTSSSPPIKLIKSAPGYSSIHAIPHS